MEGGRRERGRGRERGEGWREARSERESEREKERERGRERERERERERARARENKGKSLGLFGWRRKRTLERTEVRRENRHKVNQRKNRHNRTVQLLAFKTTQPTPSKMTTSATY